MKINKLIGYRKSLGQTQAQFAKNIGMTTSTYGMKERDDSTFTIIEAKSIMDYLKQFYPDLTFEQLFF